MREALVYVNIADCANYVGNRLPRKFYKYYEDILIKL